MRVVPIPCLSDNYSYLVACEATGEALIVDASEAAPVLSAVRAFEASGGRVVAVLSTHHHHDHVGGNEALAAALGPGLRIYGHTSDRGRIPSQTNFLSDGDELSIGSLRVVARHVPGHTLGAVAYVVRGSDDGGATPEIAAFTGDTLFLGGCGRLFEGTPDGMASSLATLARLPARTRVYPGHEYTEANLAFAAHVEPSNDAVGAARARARELREAGRPTVPATLESELRVNPFLRLESPELRATLGIPASASPAEAFALVRRAKDVFRA